MAKGYFCPRCLERIAEESVVYRTRTGEQTEKPRLVYERGPREWSRAIWHGDPSPLYQRSSCG